MEDRDWIDMVERRFQRQEAVLAEQTSALRTMVAVLRDLADGLREHRTETRDLRAESRAHTDALMRMIDRMDRLDPGGSAA